MAKDNSRTEASATATEVPKTSAEPKFPYDVLAANCTKLFGVTSSTFAGATIGKESGEYTKSEMKGIIDAWMKKPIKLKEDKK